jgi:hypothetical protein
MKNVSLFWKSFVGAGVALAVVALAAGGYAQGKTEKAKPYPLKTCIVSGEKLDGDMGKPYVFTYQGREIKLCCKSCLKDFNKEPAKFIKKLEEAEKSAAKPGGSAAKGGQGHEGHGGHQH